MDENDSLTSLTFKRRLVVYVDVDDTLVRSAGTKRMPIPAVVSHVRDLAVAGVQLYCWSTAGAEYARSMARELSIEECFAGFLPKPDVLIDDQDVLEFMRMRVVHPLNVEGKTADAYRSMLKTPRESDGSSPQGAPDSGGKQG